MLTARLRRWGAGALGLCVALGALGWFVLVGPALQDAADLRTQTEAQDAANTVAQQEIATLQEQYADLGTTKRSLAKVLRTVPRSQRMSSVLRQLRTAATHSGVDLTDVTPAGTADLVAAEGAAGTRVVATTLSLTFSGQYYQTRTFLKDLAGAKVTRAFLVTGLTITRDEETDGQVDVTLVGQVFSVPDVQEQIDAYEAAAGGAA